MLMPLGMKKNRDGNEVGGVNDFFHRFWMNLFTG